MNKARILAQIAKLQKEQCGLSYYIERNKADIIKLEKEYRDNQNLLDYYKGEIKWVIFMRNYQVFKMN